MESGYINLETYIKKYQFSNKKIPVKIIQSFLINSMEALSLLQILQLPIH